MNTITLRDICKKLDNGYGLYVYEKMPNPLTVMYRVPGPDCEDMLVGYCKVSKTDDDFTIESCDGDSYSLDDEIILWEFNGTLTVWIEGHWI